jgi:hypothetical protein
LFVHLAGLASDRRSQFERPPAMPLRNGGEQRWVGS